MNENQKSKTYQHVVVRSCGQGWDNSTCGGGVWFDSSRTMKAAIENVQTFQLGHRLARLGVAGQGTLACISTLAIACPAQLNPITTTSPSHDMVLLWMY